MFSFWTLFQCTRYKNCLIRISQLHISLSVNKKKSLLTQDAEKLTLGTLIYSITFTKLQILFQKSFFKYFLNFREIELSLKVRSKYKCLTKLHGFFPTE